MPPLLRSVLAVLAGIVVGSVVNYAIVMLNIRIYPLPAGVDPRDYAALREVMAEAPLAMLLLVILAHSGGTLVGASVAAKLAGRAPLVHGLIIGVWFLIGGIANAWMLRPPLWFLIVDLALYLPAGWLGWKLVGSRAAAPR
jgi:hypothetical protein